MSTPDASAATKNTTTDAARDAGQQYQFRCNEDGVTEIVTARDMEHAKELAEDWMRGGEWGTDGARVGVTVTPLRRPPNEPTGAKPAHAIGPRCNADKPCASFEARGLSFCVNL